jgi:uncharacterized protein (DUF2252 family)
MPGMCPAQTTRAQAEWESGRAVRKVLRRSSLGDWTVIDRDPTDVLLATSAGRVPELLPIRWGRMSISPFGFYRGAAPLMAADLASRPRTPIEAQICGDAHVRNVGAYESSEGNLVFDINDFDETVRGPFEWDLLRFATSLLLIGQDAGCEAKQLDAAPIAFSAAYRRGIARFACMRFINVMRADVKRIVTERPTHRVLLKAEKATTARLLPKLTVQTPDGWRLVARAPLMRQVDAETRDAVIASLARYAGTLTPEHRLAVAHYQPVDVAFKVVGTGSVGTRDYVVLCAGAAKDDVLFLQVKEAIASAYEPYVGRQVEEDGRRVAEGQRLMQRATDPFLGWTDVKDRSFIVRQLSDHKAGIEPEDVRGDALAAFAEVAGEIFARAHARTGSAPMIAGYVGRTGLFDYAIARFAAAYAKQTRQDHKQFVRAIKKGRIEAVVA